MTNENVYTTPLLQRPILRIRNLNAFWGLLILIALVVCCLLAVKAIEKLRNPPKFDHVAAEAAQREREEFLLAHGTEIERGAIKRQRRQAAQAQQKQSKT